MLLLRSKQLLPRELALLPLLEAVEKAYAVTAATRCAAAPDIPTVDEGGLPGVHILAWYTRWLMPSVRSLPGDGA